MKLVKWLDEHLEEALMVILLIVITCVCLLQVVIRKIPWIPSLTWAEEFCRFCWIWSVFLSLPYTIKKGSMLRVTMMLDILSDRMRNVLNIIVDVITVLCMAVLAFFSVEVVKNIWESGETSSAMMWPMWVVYSMMLIGFALAVIRGVQQIICHVKAFDTRSMSSKEKILQAAQKELEMAKGGND